jgi:hypothetical protein
MRLGELPELSCKLLLAIVVEVDVVKHQRLVAIERGTELADGCAVERPADVDTADLGTDSGGKGSYLDSGDYGCHAAFSFES